MSAAGISPKWIKFLNNLHCHSSWTFFRKTWPSSLTPLFRCISLSVKWRHRTHFWGCKRGDLFSDGLVKDIDGFVRSYFSSSYAQYTELNRIQDIRGHLVFSLLEIFCFLFACFSSHTVFLILLKLFLSLQTSVIQLIMQWYSINMYIITLCKYLKLPWYLRIDNTMVTLVRQKAKFCIP